MSAVPNPTVPKPNKPTLIPTKIHLLLHRQKSGSPQKVRILGEILTSLALSKI